MGPDQSRPEYKVNAMPALMEDIFKLKVDVDPKDGVKHLKTFGKAFRDSMGVMRQSMKKMDNQQRLFFRETHEAWDEYQDDVRYSVEVSEGLKREIVGLTKDIAEFEDKAKKAFKEVKPDKAALEAYQNGLKELQDNLESLKKGEKELPKLMKKVEAEQYKKRRETLTDAGEKTGEAIAKAFNKDVVGNLSSVIKGLGGRLGSGMDRHGRAGEKWAAAKGAALKERGAAKDGIAGGAMKLAGGGLEKALGPVLGMVSKLGPLLSVASGFFVGIVKLLIDADSQAKEFQKDLLASASTGEMLAKSGYSADVAYVALRDTVSAIRDAAFDAETNLKWGTTAKDHLAFWNTLNQEGTSINRMNQEFDAVKKSSGGAISAVDFYSKTVATAVGFSKNFGVTLNEITSFQSEMMSGLGMSLDNVQGQFSEMAAYAGDSGIAMNKFFAIMRGVSSDLSLYNLRMSDAAALLSKIGKAMNPREAAKFMQTMAQGFKGMGRMERMQMVMLAGPENAKKIVEKNLASKKSNLIGDLTKSLKEHGKDASNVGALVEGAISGGAEDRAAFAKKINELPDEAQSAFREAATKIRSDTTKSKKGPYGVAQATGNLSAGGQLDMIKQIGLKWAKNGAKTLADAQGDLGFESIMDKMGKSPEQVEQLVALEGILEDTRKEMTDKMKSGDASITQAMIDDTDAVLKWGGHEKDAEKLTKSQLDYAEQQTNMTQSLMDKLDVLTQYLINQVYTVLLDIYDAIPFPGKKDVMLLRAANASPELRKLLAEAGGDADKFKDALKDSGIVKGIRDAVSLHGDPKAIDDKIKSIDEQLTPERTKRLQMSMGREGSTKYIQDLGEQRKGLLKDKDDATNGIAARKKLGSSFKNDAQGLGNVFELSGVLGHGTEDPAALQRKGKFNDELRNSGGDVETAMQKAGYSPEDIAKVFGEMMTRLTTATNPKDVQRLMNLNSAGGVPAKPGSPATAPANPSLPVETLTSAGVPPAQARNLVGQSAAPAPAPAVTTDAGGNPISIAPAAPAPAMPGPVQGKAAEDAQKTNEAQLDALDDLHSDLRRTGIKMDKVFLTTQFGKQMDESVLSAVRQALFEFWLYQDEDKDDAKKAVQKGGLADWVHGVTTDDDDDDTEAEANALGGTVVGLHANSEGLSSGKTTGGRRAKKHQKGSQNGGPAKIVRPAPGETLASIGLDESILPAGVPQVSYANVKVMMAAAEQNSTPQEFAILSKIVTDATSKAQDSYKKEQTQTQTQAAGGGTLKVDVDVRGLIGPDFDAYLKGVITDAIYEYEKKQCLGRT